MGCISVQLIVDHLLSPHFIRFRLEFIMNKCSKSKIHSCHQCGVRLCKFAGGALSVLLLGYLLIDFILMERLCLFDVEEILGKLGTMVKSQFITGIFINLFSCIVLYYTLYCQRFCLMYDKIKNFYTMFNRSFDLLRVKINGVISHLW